MARLTEREWKEKAQIGIPWHVHPVKDIDDLRYYTKLAEYEDADESGLLMRLPCKIGDMVYINIFTRKNTCNHTIAKKVVGIHIVNAPAARGNKQRDNYLIIHNSVCNTLQHISFKKIGKTVFFTEEAALKAREKE